MKELEERLENLVLTDENINKILQIAEERIKAFKNKEVFEKKWEKECDACKNRTEQEDDFFIL